MEDFVFRIHSFFVFFMTGVIWLVQLVVYPQFQRVTGESFRTYYLFHARWISLIIIPMMIGQGLSAGALWVQKIFLQPHDPAMTNFAELGIIAGLPMIFTVAVIMQTMFWEIPLHLQLGKVGHNPLLVRKLVRDNWWRTITWSIHAVWLLTVKW
jgi:hypothetical protein